MWVFWKMLNKSSHDKIITACLWSNYHDGEFLFLTLSHYHQYHLKMPETSCITKTMEAFNINQLNYIMKQNNYITYTPEINILLIFSTNNQHSDLFPSCPSVKTAPLLWPTLKFQPAAWDVLILILIAVTFLSQKTRLGVILKLGVALFLK